MPDSPKQESDGEISNIDNTTVSIKTTFSEDEKKYTVPEYDSDGNSTGKTEEKTYTDAQMIAKIKSTMYPSTILSQKQGLKIDLNSGIIHGYDLYLKGMKSKGDESKFILLDSGANTYPFQIGPNFKVSWDGELTCDSIKYLGNRPNSGNYVINIADNFVVNSSGGGSAPGLRVGSAGFAGIANGLAGYQITNMPTYSGYAVIR